MPKVKTVKNSQKAIAIRPTVVSDDKTIHIKVKKLDTRDANGVIKHKSKTYDGK